MNVLYLILLSVAVVLFLVSSFDRVPRRKVDLVCVGLACFAAVPLIQTFMKVS